MASSWGRRGFAAGSVVTVGIVAAILLGGGPVEMPEPIRVVRVVPDDDNPLRGELRLQASEPVTVTAEVRGPDGRGSRVSPPGTPSRSHTVPLLGLAPEREYTVTLEVDPEGPGRVVSTDAGALRTGPLPDDFPPVDVTTDPSSGEGLTFFDVAWRVPDEEDRPRDHGYLVAVDASGEVVWFHAEEQAIQDALRTEAGTFLFIYNETGLREVSPTGDLVREWVGNTGRETAPDDEFGRRVHTEDAIPVDTDQMHHEIAELPNGNLITLSREIRTIEYPEAICEDVPFDGTYEVGGDVVVEFEPETGEVVKEFSLFDALEPLDNLPRTKTSSFCSSYLEPVYPGRDARDWTHANAVVLDESRNALIVSVRHTDSVVALRYDDEGRAGGLLWTLGEDGDFDLAGDGEWFLHQHAPEIQPDGSILLYDNGNERPGTSLEDEDRSPYSRAVRYRIDEEEGTAEQVWEHRAVPGEAPSYAPYVGDADRTDDGTVLIAHGGLLEPPSHSPVSSEVVAWSRILEVDVSSGEPVLDIRMKDPDGEEGWRAYRAERIPSLYPAGYTVEPLSQGPILRRRPG